MRIALTEHAKGIGAAVFKNLVAKNYEVFNFNSNTVQLRCQQ
jgi:hypothetical protein